MNRFENILQGGDLRSIGEVNSILSAVKTQDDFDELFECLCHADRIVAMRAADAIEKITIERTFFLARHKEKIIALSFIAQNKEMQWHLAAMLSRLQLTDKELTSVWDTLKNWTLDKSCSRIVRVNSLQALFDLTKNRPQLLQRFKQIMTALQKENLPSINARIRKIEKQLNKINQ